MPSPPRKNSLDLTGTQSPKTSRRMTKEEREASAHDRRKDSIHHTAFTALYCLAFVATLAACLTLSPPGDKRQWATRTFGTLLGVALGYFGGKTERR